MFLGKHFVKQCLTRDPLRRPDAKNLLVHPWLGTLTAGGTIIKSPNFLVQIQSNFLYSGQFCMWFCKQMVVNMYIMKKIVHMWCGLEPAALEVAVDEWKRGVAPPEAKITPNFVYGGSNSSNISTFWMILPFGFSVKAWESAHTISITSAVLYNNTTCCNERNWKWNSKSIQRKQDPKLETGRP